MIIAQITDLHVGWRVATTNMTVDMGERLKRAVEHLNGMDPAPDVVIATGDLTNAGHEQQYASLTDILSALSIPIYVIPGNHDDREKLRRAFHEHRYLRNCDRFLHYVIDNHSIRLIALDTVAPGEEGGELCEERLDWFESKLCEAPESPTFVFAHHPPFVTLLPLFDQVPFRGGAAVAAVVARHKQIIGFVCGHVHRAIFLNWCGTHASVCPSTGLQFQLDLQNSGNRDPIADPPACQLHIWSPETGLITHTSYIGT